MKPFKFFQKGTLVDPTIMNRYTYSTASFRDDSPEGYNGRRRLYHTNIQEYNARQELTRTINGSGNIHNDNHGNTDYVPFSFGTTRVTRVNPKWWMKVKIFFQKLFLYSDQIFPIVIFSILITVIVSAVIAKILNVW